MDWLAVGMTVRKNLNGNLLEALAAKSGIELLQPQLRVYSNKLPKVSKCGFLGLGLSACIIGESLKTLCPVALLSNVGCHRVILGEEGILVRSPDDIHSSRVLRFTDRSEAQQARKFGHKDGRRRLPSRCDGADA